MSRPPSVPVRGQPVGPRVPKQEFMRALGLDENKSEHEAHYRAMRDEAINVYTQLNADRSCLIDDRRNDPNTQPPFFWHHVRPERRRAAIVATWQNARPSTIQRQLFDLGATTGEYEPNWVTLWLLYSVFRSRDIRNNRNRKSGDDKTQSGGPRTSGSDSRIYDPARNMMVSR